MPVIMQLPRPTVNYVGNTEMAPHSPALDPNGFERRKPKYVMLISPEGDEEDVLADNVRDFERLKNYKRKRDVVKDDPEKPGAIPESTREAVEVSVGQGRLDEQQAAMAYLAELRSVLVQVGVDVDKRWGIKRLRDEITERKLVVPERKEEPAAGE